MDCSTPGLPVPHCLPEFAQVHVLGISDSIQLSHPLPPSFPLPSIFPLAQTVKLLPTMQETQVQSLGWEDPLEKEVATHSSTLAWKIPWMEEPGRLHSMGPQRVGHDWATSLSLHLSQHQGLFQWLDCLHQVTKVLELQYQIFQWVLRVDFL